MELHLRKNYAKGIEEKKGNLLAHSLVVIVLKIPK